jgi:hypothetical protein
LRPAPVGALTASVSAAPWRVHACACLECQRRSGSAFSYSAFFAEGDVTVSGEAKRFRRIADSGKYSEANFCPSCGCTVFSRLEGIPNTIVIPVGSFADPAFDQPIKLYWAMRRHSWLATPPGATMEERQ